MIKVLLALGSTESQPTFQVCPPSHREPSDLFIFVIILDFKSKDGLFIFALMRPTQRGQYLQQETEEYLITELSPRGAVPGPDIKQVLQKYLLVSWA